jgi:hypothetical protein
MRPAGEVRLALIRAAQDIFSEGRGATLVELAQRACVGREVARQHISNIKRAGLLRIVGERRVPYRNRPVAEYAPVISTADALSLQPWSNLNHCMSTWTR